MIVVGPAHLLSLRQQQVSTRLLCAQREGSNCYRGERLLLLLLLPVPLPVSSCHEYMKLYFHFGPSALVVLSRSDDECTLVFAVSNEES